MPDERLDSQRQGMAPAPESAEARRADAERRAENLRHPLEMEGALGGTSDAETAGDEAALEAELHRGRPDDRAASDG